jgi:predicted adenine nucleotide alpha hydrolase (AANH) superfamily ATPase
MRCFSFFRSFFFFNDWDEKKKARVKGNGGWIPGTNLIQWWCLNPAPNTLNPIPFAPLKKLLLHVCCGPCSTEVINRLAAEWELTLFFYNPNIFPKEEYERRLSEAEGFAAGRNIRFIRGDWDHEKWLAAVLGLENEPEGGKRCRACFAHRLGEAAKIALCEGAEAFTTTLTISPHKKAVDVNSAGEEAGEKEGVAYISEDFKKKDGFLKSCRAAREAGMYRQDYCGCEFSARKRNLQGSK